MPYYKLDNIDTSNDLTVAGIIKDIHTGIFPGVDHSFVDKHFRQVVKMFSGQYMNFQAMDTQYHNLEHTMQATLCWVRMMANRQLSGVEPEMKPWDFEVGFVGILFHDVGYLKEKGDDEGTGAKFTFVHEIRSCEVAEVYLEEIEWSKEDIFAVQHLISCTGPRSVIDSIPFRNKLERVMGEAVCTADYVGQMSDPAYIRKLPVLFNEFEESDNFREVPHEKRLFKSCDALVRGTPFFWENIVIKKLNEDCHGLYKYLAEPYPDGNNPYLEKIEQNIDRIRELIESGESVA